MERIALLLGFASSGPLFGRERPTRETSAHAGRTEGIIGQNMQPVIAPKTETGSLRPAPPPEGPCSELP